MRVKCVYNIFQKEKKPLLSGTWKHSLSLSLSLSESIWVRFLVLVLVGTNRQRGRQRLSVGIQVEHPVSRRATRPAFSSLLFLLLLTFTQHPPPHSLQSTCNPMPTSRQEQNFPSSSPYSSSSSPSSSSFTKKVFCISDEYDCGAFRSVARYSQRSKT